MSQVMGATNKARTTIRRFVASMAFVVVVMATYLLGTFVNWGLWGVGVYGTAVFLAVFGVAALLSVGSLFATPLLDLWDSAAENKRSRRDEEHERNHKHHPLGRS